MKYSIAVLAAIVAVEASPLPQGVTGAISPTAAAPAGCTGSYPSSFGIANIAVTNAASGAQATQASDGQAAAGAVSQIADAQPQAPTGVSAAPVSQIGDGQIQGASTQVMVPVTQIADGQVQGPTVVLVPASQIADGQPQAPTGQAITQIADGQPQAPTATGISQIADGQPQAPTGPAITQISDGQPQAPTATGISQIGDGQPQAPTGAGISQIGDGQPQAPTATGATQLSDGQPQAGAGSSSSQTGSGQTSIAFCQTESTLALTLDNGVLKDKQGRTGYIASNYQFQFDSPPQADAIFTSGFSVCGNGTLSLGGSSIWYQCLSGDFYNIYDRHWAPQCSPIYIQTGSLVQC